MWLTSSNTLSLLRAPLSLFFIINHPGLRCAILFLAMVSDGFDGYLARRFQTISRFGAILDPMMDKLFVYVAILTLFSEGQMLIFTALSFIARDFFLLVFVLYLALSGQLSYLQFRSVRWGKVTTTAQFVTLFLIVLGYGLPHFVHYIFIVMGLMTSLELARSLLKKKEMRI
ncbi:MAG: CDP-alcohol phosphatidyltransferase family protein [Chlamydiota bacterium]|nr:CDP-alcohol phosphatidyltransferase family protein [Chlamydiota bacterium]